MHKLTPIPAGEPIELVFSLLPTAYRFKKGHRLRIHVIGADADNFEMPVLDPAPQFRMLRNLNHLPVTQFPIIQS